MSIEYTNRGQVRIDGRTAGAFDERNGFILDASNRKIGRVDVQGFICDGQNKKIGRVDRQGFICDGQNKKIGRIIPDGVEFGSPRMKIQIKGTETLSDVARVAIVHFLVKHILTF